MAKVAIITVSTDTPPHRLSPEDLEVPGVYGVIMGDGVGEYSETPRNPVQGDEDPVEEAALDVFHDKIGIDCLDDFVVDVQILHPNDDGPDDVIWL